SVGNSLFLCAAQIRRNSEISIFNSLILGWGEGKVKGLLIDASKGTPTDLSLAPTGGLNFGNNIIAGNTANAVDYAESTTAPTGTITANNTDVGLVAPFNYSAPDFNPSTSSSIAATGASFSSSKLTTKTAGVDDFTAVTYKGACAVGDTWWKTWTKF
ncbi:MAG: hypothetical protein EBZ95_01295, partial [Chitinophagia bacterium]|nr:hypothetical protein [Chitinophagia bacterium]